MAAIPSGAAPAVPSGAAAATPSGAVAATPRGAVAADRPARAGRRRRGAPDDARAAGTSEAEVLEVVEVGYAFGGTTALVMAVNAFTS